MRDAEHGEAYPKTSRPIISSLSRSIIDEIQTVYISPHTLAYKIYRKEKPIEKFNCSYGFIEAFHKELNEQDLKIAGVDDNGNARIVELSDHRFLLLHYFCRSIPQALKSLIP